MKQALLSIFMLSVLSCQKTVETSPVAPISGELPQSSGIVLMREGGGEELSCGQLKTHTPGGWGTQPNGENPGAYVFANFATAFPEGLTVGCLPEFHITLTSAQAVADFLPSGGKAKSLNANHTNPGSMKNVLAGHLVALTLNVTFDDIDPNFGEAGVNLGAMIIQNGLFKGWNVYDFLTEANQILGGCSKQYNVQQVLVTASNINENYIDGAIDNGYLVCPN